SCWLRFAMHSNLGLPITAPVMYEQDSAGLARQALLELRCPYLKGQQVIVLPYLGRVRLRRGFVYRLRLLAALADGLPAQELAMPPLVFLGIRFQVCPADLDFNVYQAQVSRDGQNISLIAGPVAVRHHDQMLAVEGLLRESSRDGAFSPFHGCPPYANRFRSS